MIYPKAMSKDWAEHKPSIVFECEDIRKTYDELVSRGVTFPQPLQDLPWGPWASFEDLEGNQYGLRQK